MYKYMPATRDCHGWPRLESLARKFDYHTCFINTFQFPKSMKKSAIEQNELHFYAVNHDNVAELSSPEIANLFEVMA